MIDRDELQDRMLSGARGPRPTRAAALPAPTLTESLAAARALQPPDGSCRACFRAGRDAAADAVERGDRAGAAALKSKHVHLGDPDSFAQGRDAVLAVVTGE